MSGFWTGVAVTVGGLACLALVVVAVMFWVVMTMDS